MKIYKHHWPSEIENRLRSKGILFDFEGNKLQYNRNSKTFDYGVYTGKESALIGRCLFSSNPRKSKYSFICRVKKMAKGLIIRG